MKLTQEQINYLFSFCAEQGIEYYDVQIEMVDHIANIVEQLQKDNPQLSFQDALCITEKEFDKNEFQAILAGKKKTINKLVSTMIEKEFISFFTPPKIFLTISFLLLSYLMPYLINRLGFAVLIAYMLVFVPVIWVGIPLDKHVKAIKEAEVLPLLSLKIKTKYETVVRVIQIAISLLITVSSFLRNESPAGNEVYLSAGKILKMQMLFTFFTFYLLFYLAILHVRNRFYTKILYDYPKAFGS